VIDRRVGIKRYIDAVFEERQRLKQLERENFELRRANEILKKAAAFFAQAELDRRAK
jgi:transposase-like protein